MSDTLTLYKDDITGLDYANDIGETTPVSWQPKGNLNFEEWIAIGNTLQQVNASLNWWIGDWLNYGERRWGEMYAQAVEVTGWDYEKLRRTKWVAGAVQLCLRKHNLTWSHHLEVAQCDPDEQAAWLNRASVEGWSVRRLREEIKGPQLPPPALSFAEPDEVPFNHQPRTDISASERTPVDEYEQQPQIKTCKTCGNIWMADLPFCPYCNISPEARVFYAEREEKLRHDYPLAAANHAVSSDPDYDGDEWYTPREIITAARKVMGDIDLDPASCVEAQERICAARYLTQEDDALRDDLEWHGRIWLNPPYSMPLIKQFVAKLIDQYESGNISQAIILTNNSSDTSWFHDLLSRYPACFTRGRVQFWRADSTTFGARQGQTLFYLGDNFRAFREVFSELGQVVVKA